MHHGCCLSRPHICNCCPFLKSTSIKRDEPLPHGQFLVRQWWVIIVHIVTDAADHKETDIVNADNKPCFASGIVADRMTGHSSFGHTLARLASRVLFITSQGWFPKISTCSWIFALLIPANMGTCYLPLVFLFHPSIACQGAMVRSVRQCHEIIDKGFVGGIVGIEATRDNRILDGIKSENPTFPCVIC